jgi:predicted RNase H-like HicB family nuclease
MNMKRNLTYVLFEEDGAYIARCLDVEVASEGDNGEQALTNLQEALQLYFEDVGTELDDIPLRIYEFGDVSVGA